MGVIAGRVTSNKSIDHQGRVDTHNILETISQSQHAKTSVTGLCVGLCTRVPGCVSFCVIHLSLQTC